MRMFSGPVRQLGGHAHLRPLAPRRALPQQVHEELEAALRAAVERAIAGPP
jgi:hypothetical protein